MNTFKNCNFSKFVKYSCSTKHLKSYSLGLSSIHLAIPASISKSPHRKPIKFSSSLFSTTASAPVPKMESAEHTHLASASSIFTSLSALPKYLDMYVFIEDGSVKISYTLNDGKMGTMNRTLEPISKTLQRLQLTIQKSLNTSSKKSKSAKFNKQALPTGKNDMNTPAENTQDGGVSKAFRLFHLNEEIENLDSIDNFDFKEGMIIELCEEKILFKVILHPPSVTELSIFPLHKLYMGLPIVPQMYCIHCDDKLVTYQWARGDKAGKEFINVSTEPIYFPVEDDVGYRLRLTVTPRRVSLSNETEFITGPESVVYSHGLVEKNVGLLEKSLLPKIVDIRKRFIDGDDIDEIDTMASILEDLELSTHTDSNCRKTGISSKSNSKLRVVTYNILADMYATSEFAKSGIYPYCSLDYLVSEYRLPMILKELLSYNCDVIALQECETRAFESYLKPALQRLGYKGWLTLKSLGSEGCVFFVNTNTVNILKAQDLTLKDVLKSSKNFESILENRADVKDIICSNLGMISQILVIQKKCEDKVESSESNMNIKKSPIFILGNTHLFFHPYAGYVRLVQSDAILSHMFKMKADILNGSAFSNISDGVVERLTEKKSNFSQDSVIGGETYVASGYDSSGINNCGGGGVASAPRSSQSVKVILMGDLNSTPDSGVTEYLQSGEISSDHPVWKTMNEFCWGMRMEGLAEGYGDSLRVKEEYRRLDLQKYVPETLKLPSKFKSASSLFQATNYTSSFKDVLDYVWIESDSNKIDYDLECKEDLKDDNNNSTDNCSSSSISSENNELLKARVAPFPSDLELSAHTAIPSKHFPSDHVSVLVDIYFN